MAPTRVKVIGKAMEAASVAAVSIRDMDQWTSKMNEKQKTLFESLMSGDDELISCIKAGHQDYYTGITKLLTNKPGIDPQRIMSHSVTLENVYDLTSEDYERLRRICASKVRYLSGTDDYRNYTAPIREYIKRFAPMALGTVMDVMQNATKDDIRLKAAKDLLDRADERGNDKDIVVPVQVNIVLTNKDGTTTAYQAGA